MKFRALLSFVAFLSIGASGYAESSPDDLNREATSVYQQIMSPFCPGRSLNDCPSPRAHELKDQIRGRLEGGEEPNQVIESVVAAYGEEFRAVPRNQGFGRLVWLVPLGFLGVGIFLWLWLGARRRGTQPQAAAISPVSAAIEKEIAEELAKIEE